MQIVKNTIISILLMYFLIDVKFLVFSGNILTILIYKLFCVILLTSLFCSIDNCINDYVQSRSRRTKRKVRGLDFNETKIEKEI